MEDTEGDCDTGETNNTAKEHGGGSMPDHDVASIDPAKQCGDVLQTSFGPVPKFEAIPDNIPTHPSILAAGKRRTGKSTSLDNLMSRTMRDIPFGIVMTETKMNGFWQQRVPERLVFQGWREDLLLALIKRQKRMIKEYGKKDPRTFAFIILDDVIADQKAIRWSKNVNSFFVEGRHLNITVLLTTQYMKGVGPMIRGNMDIAFLQPIYSVLDRAVIRDLYGGFMRKPDFMTLMDEIIQVEELPGSTAHEPKLNMRIMVVQDWRQTSEVSKKFCWWDPVHSDSLEPYRLCDPKYWEEDSVDAMMAGNEGQEEEKRASVVDTLDEVSSVFAQ